jgi:hypothetical protein
MILEILPEVAYQIGGELRLTLHAPESAFGPTTQHFYFAQPEGAWDDAALIAVVQSRFPDAQVSFRLPEVTPTETAENE